MKELSYLQAFSPKILREARRILSKGFTAEDIDSFLERTPENGTRKEMLAKTKFGKKKP